MLPLLLLLALALLPQRPAAQAVQGVVPGQLGQAAAGQRDKVTGALREVISYERQVASQAQSGANPASAMRARNSARQRLDLALVQLAQWQGNPQGVASALAGAQRQVQQIDQRLLSLGSQRPSASSDRELQNLLRDRNRAQQRVNQVIQRWNALLNGGLPGPLRGQRVSAASNINGALRELESYDNQLVQNVVPQRDATLDSLQGRLERLEKQIRDDQEQLRRVQHQGGVKAAQNNSADDLERRIQQNQREAENLKRQMESRQRQQAQASGRQSSNVLGNRLNALERYRRGWEQLLQFDATLR